MAAEYKPVLSPYVLSLDKQVKARYVEKIKCIGGIDPYVIPESQFDKDIKLLPPVSWPDLFTFFIINNSFYTKDQLKAYKSLEAYNQFTSGWVKSRATKEIKEKIVILSKVLHSQSPSATPLQAWVIASKEGDIEYAHCKCMAGLAESCTHIAATLFSVEAAVRYREVITPTQEPAYWVGPGMAEAKYAEVSDIDFSSASAKRKKLDQTLSGICARQAAYIPNNRHIPETSNEEFDMFFKNIANAGTKPAILSIIPEHCDTYIPRVLSGQYPKVLSEMKKDQYLKLSYDELVKEGENVSLEVSSQEITNVEESTKEQTDSKLWYRFRAGRITASKLKSACRTDPNKPSKSLIKQICYPEMCRFSTKATSWGCTHEKEALERYIKHQQNVHDNFVYQKSGFWIWKDHPFIGASPDGLVFCTCHGEGCVEVKCPYCKKDMTIIEACKNKFCLKDEGGTIKLDERHAYYYQVQAHMYCSGRDYCDFVIYTESELYIDRFECDEDIKGEVVDQCSELFKLAILPELLGSFFTRPQTTSQSGSNDKGSIGVQVNMEFCYCRKGDDGGEMVVCENEDCAIKKFHLHCLGLKRKPGKKSKWYCTACKVLPQFKKDRTKQSK